MGGKGTVFNSMGGVYRSLKRPDKALSFYVDAAVKFREEANLAGEASARDNIASLQASVGRRAEALQSYEQALVLWQQVRSTSGEIATLNSMAAVYRSWSRSDKAISCCRQALDVAQKWGERRGEASTLNNLGLIYYSLGQYDTALSYYQQALPILRTVKDEAGQAATLNNLGLISTSLGQHPVALAHYEAALSIKRRLQDGTGEGVTLDNIGSVYGSMGQAEKAIEYHERALQMARATGQAESEAAALSNLARAHSSQGRFDVALKMYEAALTLARDAGNRIGEGSILHNLGYTLRLQGNHTRAISYYHQALPIRREVGDLAGESFTLNNLMFSSQALAQPRLAIFYGKQAVNASQALRRNIQGFDQQTRQGFVSARQDTYRTLADLLINQGRLPEAEQVLGLLKQEEFFQFVRRESSQAVGLEGTATLSPVEAQAQQRAADLAARVTQIGARRGELLVKESRSQAEEEELEASEASLQAANSDFEKFLDGLATYFSQSTQSGRVAQLRDAQGLQETLRELGHGAVALYTLVTEDKVRVMLVTPDARASSEHAIKREQLDSKVLALREALRNPRVDPRPLAQEMYGILLGPLRQALENAKGQTLMWSLDGPLRYLPVAALHDGENYLVERFNNTVFTPASASNLKDNPGGKWRALGLGVTKEKPGFKALPGVEQELRGIVASEGEEGEAAREVGVPTGVVPGTVALDESFTEAAMKSRLLKRPSLVHIASHFQFQPGDETKSFLLLGDGSHFTLDQIKNLSFGGVKLLTLSACDTASGGTGADGQEVEGFAVLAQRQGAQAVLATLWPVADSSTQILMREFYRLRQAQPGTPKAQALRQAQIAMLRGEAQGASEASNARGSRSDEEATGARANPNSPFSHPYFWAPFVLIGNWR